MGLFDQFPYTNFHELNLDWILKALKDIEHTLDQFVSINALKYADPIQWNITKQYEKNTIVIEPNSGTAYISVQPVPAGVNIDNTDYWTVVFDLGMFVVRAAKNLATKYEEDTTNTATQAINKDEWFVWGDTLYKALANIIAGDQFVIGSNIDHFTIESVTGHLEDLATTDKSNLVAAINEVLQTLIDTAGDLDDLNTTDKSNLVNAINEVLQALIDTAGDLGDLNTTDKSNLVNAINEVNTTGGGALAKIGDLDDLNTTDKSNLVNAINELVDTDNNLTTLISNKDIIAIKDYGAVCDGVTDDTDAIRDAIAAAGNKILVFNGDVLVSGCLDITEPMIIIGNGHTVYTDANFTTGGGVLGNEIFPVYLTDNVYITDITIDGTNTTAEITGIILNQTKDISIHKVNILNVTGRAVWVRDDNYNIDIVDCYCENCDQTGRMNGGGAFHVALGDGNIVNHNIHFQNCKAKSCGNSGFCFYDTEQTVVENCISIDMLGPDNWELANGFIIGFEVKCINCLAENCENTGYYINGGNNILDSCSAIRCGGMAADFYTGSGNAYGNVIDGCLFNNCAQSPHTDIYPESKVIGGTNQFRFMLTDTLISGCGNSTAPLEVICIDGLSDSSLNNINIQDMVNLDKGLYIKGSQSNNTIQNCRLNGDTIIPTYSSTTYLVNNSGGNNNPHFQHSQSLSVTIDFYIIKKSSDDHNEII